MPIQIEKVRDFEGHKGAIYTMRQSDKPGHILSAGSEGIVAEWNLNTGNALAIASTSQPIFAMQVFPARQLLLLGLQNGHLVFVDLRDKSVIKTVHAHQKAIFDIKAFPSDDYFLVSSDEGAVSLWSLHTLQRIGYFPFSPQSIRTIEFSPDHKFIVLGSSDNKIRVFDLELMLQKEWTAHRLSIFRTCFSPDGKYLLSVGRDAQIKSWEVEKDFRESASVPAHMYAINDLIFHPNQTHFFTGSMDKSIKIWEGGNDPVLGKVVDFQRHQAHKNGINRLMWVDDHLFSCGDDRLIMQWKVTF